MKEDLRLHGLAPIYEEDVSPPHIAPGSVVVRPPVAKVASSGLPTRVVPIAIIPSSSSSVPPQVSFGPALL